MRTYLLIGLIVSLTYVRARDIQCPARDPTDIAVGAVIWPLLVVTSLQDVGNGKRAFAFMCPEKHASVEPPTEKVSGKRSSGK